MANESKSLIQIAIGFVSNGGDANEKLRTFQLNYPKRKIIGVSVSPVEPHGYFMTITYEINL
jgi:hypothetical protein